MLRVVILRNRLVVLVRVRDPGGLRNKRGVVKLDSQADACWTRELNYP